VRIAVKLVAYLGDPVPGIDDQGNGVIDLPEGTTLADLLGRLDVAGAELSLTLVGDVAVPERDQASRVLQDGERVTVFPPIKGG
jgi:sulfur carrier protein ThiS